MLPKEEQQISVQQEWPWDESLDAAIAAPDSHRIILENESIRTVEVNIPPGTKEPMHTHRNPSIMVVYQSAKIRYYDENGNAQNFERRNTDRNPFIESLEPEGLHAVENIDSVPYRAVRIETKVKE